MNEWKASGSEAKRLHTDSNLKTNTSFEFAQSSHFQFATPHPFALPNEEELPSSNVYFGEINNNSTISLHPTVTTTAAREFLAVVEMVRFLGGEVDQKARRIRAKKELVGRLGEAVGQVQERVNAEREYIHKKREALQKKRDRMGAFKKQKLRAVTEQTEAMQLEIDCLLKGIRPRNKNHSFLQGRQRQGESSFRETHPTRRKKIYVPIPPPHYYPHYYYPPQPHFPPAQPQPNPFLNVYSHTQYPVFHSKTDPSNLSSMNYNSHKLAQQQQQQTVQKQPLIIQQLRQALTLKLNDAANGNNLDYFDLPLDSISRSRQQEADRKSETPKSVIRRSSSIKWRKDDNEDKELVQIIERSIKYIKTEHSEVQPYQQDLKAPVKLSAEAHMERLSPVRRLQNGSDSSSINITYDSEDKRNSKSFEREEANGRGKLSSKNSEKKSERGRQIEQSNIKIELVDMSMSKNSGSSQSDSSKQPPARYLPSLAKPFQEIEEESEQMVSLKATPCDVLKNSLEKELKGGSRNKKDSPKYTQGRPLPEEEEDDILKSIKLDTESRISRTKNLERSFLPTPEGDDILDSIKLLKESKASRQKALSLKSSFLAQEFIHEEEPHREKGSQSEIFAKEDSDLPADFDSSLRLSTKSRIVKSGKNDGAEVARRGQTEPVKGQLTSIPSAEYEQEQDDTPPHSRNRPKATPRQ